MAVCEAHLAPEPDMEDEDVYFEKSQIHEFMKEMYTGSYPVYKETSRELTSPPDQDKTCVPKLPHWVVSSLLYAKDEKALNDEVTKIMTCGLLVEEHHHYLETLFVGHQRAQLLEEKKLSPMKALIWCTGVFSVAWSSAMYCLNKSRRAALHLLPFVVPLTTLACWKARKRHKRLSDAQRIEEFIAIIDKLFITVRKAIKLVQENELLVQGHLIARGQAAKVSRPPDYATSLQLMLSLRGTIFKNTKDAIEVLFRTGQELTDLESISHLTIDDYNLKDEFEEILTEDRFCFITLKRLHDVFVLTQSGIILRLALRLCSSFWITDHSTDLEKIYRAISLATIRLRCLETNLNQEYQTFYSFGLKPEDSSPTSVVVARNFKFIDVYTTVHTSVLRLQAMLFATRAVEDSIKSYTCVGNEQQDQIFVEEVDSNLSKLTDDVDALFTTFRMAMVEVKKLARRRTSVAPIAMPEKLIEVSISGAVVDQDYVVEDEVFELYCRKNDGDNNEREHDTWDICSDQLTEKEKAEQSATMVKELKTVLKGKAEEWRVREAVALLKRGPVDTENTVQENGLEEELLCDPELPEMSPSEDRQRWVDEDSARKISQAIAANPQLVLMPIDEEFYGSGDEDEDDTVESR